MPPIEIIKPYFKESRFKIAIGLLSLIVVDGLQLLVPLIIKWAVDDLTALRVPAGRMAFYQADLAAIPDLFPEAQFDLVLCHNVLQYAGDLGAATGAVCHPLRPGGLISVMCVNRYSEPYRQALMQLDLDAAYASLDAKTVFAYTFGVPVQAYVAEDLVGPLEQAGCSVIGRYGVRCVNDYIFDNNLKYDPAFFARLERLELALTDRYPYYLLARFFQLIASKKAAE